MKACSGINNRRKIIAGLLLGMFMVSVILPNAQVYAAAPSVTTDEAVYINLDYYGGMSDVSVVKSCSLNGVTHFRDYGNYESVTNMSGYDKPIVNADGVEWNLKKKAGLDRFYYNCKVKNNAIVLPWNIDVSYKLNGVPCKADNLAGAKGLVEINITAKPNNKAKVYYRNNMLLQVASYINTEEAYSIDAPGSQMQSIGTYKAVVFAALPGEEDTFTMRIGTDCFETKGITMMMIPGTLKQMEEIKKLKEAKDTVYDSAQAIYTSMNDIMNTMESMNEGLSELKNGAAGTEDARSTFSAGKYQMYQYGDTALDDISEANEQLNNMIPYFKTGQKMTRDLNNDIGNLVNTMGELKAPLEDTSDSAYTMRNDLKALQNMVNALNGQIGTTLPNLGAVAAAGGATPYEATQLQGQAGMAGTLDNYSDNINSLLSETADMAKTTSEIAGITQDLIDETEDLDNTLDDYEDDLIDILGDCKKLTKLMNNSIDSSVTFLTYSKALLQVSGDKLDIATASSLKGLNDVLDKSIIGLGSISSMRNANNTIKDAIDREFDKFENENKFLNLDAKADLISFTSNENPAPESIQIILRTKEISLNDKNGDNSDLETEKADIGVFGRIKNLFNRIMGIFH
jgi:putative membrane protein